MVSLAVALTREFLRKNLSPLVLVSLMGLLVGCGGYETEPLVVRLSPAQATVPASSSVEFYAEGNFGKYSSVDWRVVEAANLGVNCTLSFLHGQPAPSPPADCTAGWLEVEIFLGLTGYPTKQATYHAPAIAGTYHVAVLVALGESRGTANATVTVLP